MTILETPPNASSDLWGSQTPRFHLAPKSDASLGQQAVEFAARAGLFLDPWQQMVLRDSMKIEPGGRLGRRWAARNVALLVPRQNGKGSVLEARELFGMFVLGEKKIIHSAHRFDASQDHFERMRNLIDGNPDLAKHVRRPGGVITANGKESVTLKNGCQLLFKARSNKSLRGFSCDLLVCDEALILTNRQFAAMSPTSGARPNPQTWFTSSAGMPESEVLWNQVRRGREGAKRMAYFEWGCPTGVDPADRANWASANPGLGYRLSVDELENEYDNLTPEFFAQEHLGIWDDQAESLLIQRWGALRDRDSAILGPLTFAIEVSEDRKWGCIAAAGDGPAGLHVETVDYRQGTAWVVDRMADLARRHGSTVVVQPSAAAGSLIEDLEARRVTVLRAATADYQAACGQFFDLVTDSGEVRHLGQDPLDISVREALTRKSGDSWVWDRRNPNTDISPLAAVTLAAWGSRQKPKAGRFMAF